MFNEFRSRSSILEGIREDERNSHNSKRKFDPNFSVEQNANGNGDAVARCMNDIKTMTPEQLMARFRGEDF